MSRLEQNAVVQKGIRRLRAMGLDVKILAEYEKEVFVFVSLDSVLDLIRNSIEFKNKSVKYDSGQIMVHIWKR